MTTEQAKIKLAKLLALAASTNENEASVAMERAQAIMKKYKLNVADVAEDGSGAKVGKLNMQGTTRNRSPWEMTLATAVAYHFDCKCVGIPASLIGNFSFTFVGGVSDLEICKDLFARLRSAVLRETKKHTADTKREWGFVPRGTTNSFRVGMVRIITERLLTVKENMTRESYQEKATGTDLMVVKNKAVDQRYKKEFPSVRQAPRSGARLNGDSFQSGQNAGKNVSLHRSVKGGSSVGPVAIPA